MIGLVGHQKLLQTCIESWVKSHSPTIVLTHSPTPYQIQTGPQLIEKTGLSLINRHNIQGRFFIFISTAAENHYSVPIISPPACVSCVSSHTCMLLVRGRGSLGAQSHSVVCGFVPRAGLSLPSGDWAAHTTWNMAVFIETIQFNASLFILVRAIKEIMRLVTETMYLVLSVWYLRVKRSKGFFLF